MTTGTPFLSLACDLWYTEEGLVIRYTCTNISNHLVFSGGVQVVCDSWCTATNHQLWHLVQWRGR